MSYSGYIKKEDVRDIPEMERKTSAFMLISLSIVIGMMQIFVVPKFTNLYSELNIPTPPLTQSSSLVTGIIAILTLIVGLYLISTKPDYSKVDAVANKYQAGEMIKTRELIDNRFVSITLILLGLAVGYLVFSIISPIYSLVNQY